MAFTDTQIAELSAKLDGGAVKARKVAGRNVSYIEGWHAIAEANRIFGYDAWDREAVEIKCVSEAPREIGDSKAPGFGVGYVCRVRITVRAGEDRIVREGCGYGSGIDRDLGSAHESAIKEAETDAMKRALMTFGNPFGLALYDKTQENVERAPAQPARQATPPRAVVAWDRWHADAIKQLSGKNVIECRAWWKENANTLGEMHTHAPELWQGIKNFCQTAGDARQAG